MSLDGTTPHLTDRGALERTRAYVQKTFLYARQGIDLRDEERLMDRGVIDSMGVMELIAFLEQEFGVSIPDDEITDENLGSLAAIARYVTAKVAAAAPADAMPRGRGAA